MTSVPSGIVLNHRARALGVFNRKGHRLFQINVASRVERRAEVFGMQMGGVAINTASIDGSSSRRR
jgi:hypothetical protein